MLQEEIAEETKGVRGTILIRDTPTGPVVSTCQISSNCFEGTGLRSVQPFIPKGDNKGT